MAKKPSNSTPGNPLVISPPPSPLLAPLGPAVPGDRTQPKREPHPRPTTRRPVRPGEPPDPRQ